MAQRRSDRLHNEFTIDDLGVDRIRQVFLDDLVQPLRDRVNVELLGIVVLWISNFGNGRSEGSR